MSMRWFPLEKRVVKVAQLLDELSNDPKIEKDMVKLAEYNSIERCLSILEQRPPYYKKLNKLSWLDWLKVKVASLFYFGR
jgi:hypothetical protein